MNTETHTNEQSTLSPVDKVVATSPTRVDLSGGTLDLWPLYLFVGGAYTVNFAIDIETKAEIQARQDSKIVLKSVDQKIDAEYANLDEFLSNTSEKWALIRRHVEYWRPNRGFNLITSSDSPVGGGLGGSSSLSISLIKAFSKFQGKALAAHEMIQLAGNLEAKVLKTPTGTQDYYPPIFGGMNIIFYGCAGHETKVCEVPHEVFDKRFLLVYTGRPHHSGLNNWGVMKGAIDQNEKTIDALETLAEISEEVRKACENQDWKSLGGLLKREFEARVQLSKDVTSPEIEKLNEVALAAGAEAVKICGAGGGGCVMVWSEPTHIEKVKTACQNEGFQVLNAKPVPPLPRA